MGIVLALDKETCRLSQIFQHLYHSLLSIRILLWDFVVEVCDFRLLVSQNTMNNGLKIEMHNDWIKERCFAENFSELGYCVKVIWKKCNNDYIFMNSLN